MSFEDDLAAFAQKVKRRVWIARRKIALDVFSRVILRTPVDTGRARANWQTSIGSASGGVTEETDKAGGATIGKILPAVAGAETTDATMYLTNNLPYIGVLESGGFPNPAENGTKTENGFSIQAPSGMVGITVTEFDGIARSAIEAAKNGG